MMRSDPTATKKYTLISPKLTSSRPSVQIEKDAANERSHFADINEVESGRHPNLSLHTPSSSPAQLDASGLSSISFSHIVNQIWHFVSVDFGPRCSCSHPPPYFYRRWLTVNWNLDMCIGYNSVYAVSGVDFGNPSALPEGKRVWAWLILCDDGQYAYGYRSNSLLFLGFFF